MANARIGLFLLLVLGLGLAGCGGSDTPDAGGGESDGTRNAPADSGGNNDTDNGNDADPGDAGDGNTDAPPESTGELVGDWYAVSQDGTELPPDMLVFTFRDDGTGTVVEEQNVTKEYTWVYDAGERTLHILTENEDLHFTASLISNDPYMSLVIRRKAGDGGDGDE